VRESVRPLPTLCIAHLHLSQQFALIEVFLYDPH
jgi:hypothetical protein